MIIRPAVKTDAKDMCAVINPLIEAGGTTAIRDQFTQTTIRNYCLGPEGILCMVADVGGAVQGWQVLRVPPRDYNLPADWAVIATFVSKDAKQGGIGSALFADTKKAAPARGIVAIDATIKRYNTGGQKFYTKQGFVDYAQTDSTVSKKYVL